MNPETKKFEPTIAPDRYKTVSEFDLRYIISKAHEKRVHVILKPHVDRAVPVPAGIATEKCPLDSFNHENKCAHIKRSF